MSKWIELEPLIADLDKGLWGKDYDKALAEAIIREAPSIDIVRCKECKYSEKTSSPITALWCKRFGLEDMAVEDDDFCSYGVRNSSEKPNNSKERSK